MAATTASASAAAVDGKPPLLLTDLASSVSRVPSNFVRPASERPNLDDVESCDAASIPVIDLRDLDGPNRSNTIQKIGEACENYGFFQVRLPRKNRNAPTSSGFYVGGWEARVSYITQPKIYDIQI